VKKLEFLNSWASDSDNFTLPRSAQAYIYGQTETPESTCGSGCGSCGGGSPKPAPKPEEGEE